MEVNGKTYRVNESVKKLSDLERLVEYEVIAISDKPTRYNAYVVTVSDATNEFKVYMPGYKPLYNVAIYCISFQFSIATTHLRSVSIYI